MSKWLDDCRAFDPRRLYLASTARDSSSSDDYTTTHRHPEVGMVRARIKPSTDWDYEDVYGKPRLPIVAHEIGQWPIYVDWAHELAKYTGVLRPYNLEHYRDVAVKSGTERLWPRFCEVSAKLNRLLRRGRRGAGEGRHCPLHGAEREEREVALQAGLLVHGAFQERELRTLHAGIFHSRRPSRVARISHGGLGGLAVVQPRGRGRETRHCRSGRVTRPA